MRKSKHDKQVNILKHIIGFCLTVLIIDSITNQLENPKKKRSKRK